MKRALVAAVLLVALATGTVSAAIVWRSATTNSTAEAVLRYLIAAEHQRVCGSTLANDARLVWMSRYRSTDMVLNGYFAHTNPVTGKRVFDLMAKAGIGYSHAAEIIAWNTYSDDLSPKATYSQFMSSSGHRSAIRSCAYTRFGVGDYKVGTKRMYAVLFIKP